MSKIIWNITDLEDAKAMISGYSTGVNDLHILKTVNPYINLVISEEKKAELRTRDRNYKPGDILLLRQWYPIDCTWGLLNAVCGVTHIVEPDEISDIFKTDNSLNMCMMSIELLNAFKLAKLNTEISFPQ